MLALALLLVFAAPPPYELRGQLVPALAASVSLHGATTPFHASTLAGPDGKFKFGRLAEGSYTLAVFVPNRGENRLTLSIGPSTADKRHRVELAIKLDEAKMTPDRTAVVSTRELRIPEKAWREYRAAEKRLGERDVPGALAALERATATAPDFAAAWNMMGTIAYQTQQYPTAEQRFRRALEANPDAYEPLVNLGGVLLNLNRPDEAYNYNLHAVLKRPHDALANSQLGMTYLALGKLDLAEKYLKEAVRLDAGHFSHPQLLLAEIYLRRGDRANAAAQLEDYVRHHPDAPNAEPIRRQLDKLRPPRKI